jgi:predicted MFS family arabinose efflux permease
MNLRKHLQHSALMASIMTGCVSATVTAVNVGFVINESYVLQWIYAWLVAFPVGLLLLLFLAPWVHRVFNIDESKAHDKQI